MSEEIGNYPYREAHLKFLKDFTEKNPPCWRCGNSGYYFCEYDCKSGAGSASRPAHRCDCIQSGYVIGMEQRYFKHSRQNQEPYIFGGWRLKRPDLAPGAREYHGRAVGVDELLDDPRYASRLAGLDDEAMDLRVHEFIYGTRDDRKFLERQTDFAPTGENKTWHLVGEVPWCVEHNRTLHLREGEKNGILYAFYSCPAPTSAGNYCKTKVNSQDIRRQAPRSVTGEKP